MPKESDKTRSLSKIYHVEERESCGENAAVSYSITRAQQKPKQLTILFLVERSETESS